MHKTQLHSLVISKAALRCYSQMPRLSSAPEPVPPPGCCVRSAPTARMADPPAPPLEGMEDIGMHAFDILLDCSTGLAESDVRVHHSDAHDRQVLPAHEPSITSTWQARLDGNPKLFNGTKFRFHQADADADADANADAGGANADAITGANAAGGAAARAGATLLLGNTDYRSFCGTNLCAAWRELERSPTRALANPLGNAMVVETADQQVPALRCRPRSCGHCCTRVPLRCSPCVTRSGDSH